MINDPASPAPSIYKKICTICGKEVVYFPEIRKYFLDHIEIKINNFFPLILAASFVLVFNSRVLPFLEDGYQFLILMFYGFLILIIFTSYITLFEGPGYFSFLSIRTGHEENPFDGIVTTESQFMRIPKMNMPAQTYYVFNSRRYVIRPEVESIFLGCCIGKKNLKLYILLWFYLFCFSIYDMVIIVIACYEMIESISLIEDILSVISLFLICFTYGLYCFYTISRCFIRVIYNKDLFLYENPSKDTFKYDKGFLLNWNEIFGPKLLKWVLPIPVYKNIPCSQITQMKRTQA